MPVTASLLAPLILEAGTGVAGMISGSGQRRRGQAMTAKAEGIHRGINPVDPMQLSLLNDVITRQRAMEAGTSKMMGLRTREAMNALGQTQANAARQSGGSVGALMSMLTGAQRFAGEAVNEGAAIDQGQSIGLLGTQANLANTIADSRYQHSTYLRDLYAGRGAQMEQDGARNFSGGLGALLGSAIDASQLLRFPNQRKPWGLSNNNSPVNRTSYGAF